MAARADDLIDRRRLRRKLTFWRVATVIVAIIAIVIAARWTMPESIGGAAAPHVAKIKIEGTITQDEELLERLEKIAESDAVKGVIVAVNSPGGTTAGGEAIFEAVRKIAEKKPVVAEVGTLAASAGYMIASATDHIVARQSSIVGSIGVLVQFPNFTGLMEKIGVSLDGVKSSPLKAEPSPFNETTDEERAMLAALVRDSYDWFVGIVEDRRSLSRTETLALADGSIFTGRQALANKLVDALGGEDVARGWLTEKGVAADLDVVEWKKPSSSASFLLSSQAIEWVGNLLPFSFLHRDLLRETGADRLFLDGLLSVWHPENSPRRD